MHSGVHLVIERHPLSFSTPNGLEFSEFYAKDSRAVIPHLGDNHHFFKNSGPIPMQTVKRDCVPEFTGMPRLICVWIFQKKAIVLCAICQANNILISIFALLRTRCSLHRGRRLIFAIGRRIIRPTLFSAPIRWSPQDSVQLGRVLPSRPATGIERCWADESDRIPR